MVTASLRPVLTNVQVLAGASSVARLGDVVVWFETGPDGGGVMLTQLLQAVQGVASGSVPSRQMGARLAAVLNTGDAQAVPALAAATPEEGGLRVVVHGWGAVVADGVHLPNGWVDQVITDRSTFFLGRNTVTPVAPNQSSIPDLEDGVVPGDGVSFSLSTDPAPAPTPAPDPAPAAGPAAPGPAEGPPPLAWPPPRGPAVVHLSEPVQAPAPPVATTPPAAGSLPAGRLVLDDGSSAVLERPCVLGSAPQASPAVQTGVAIPLTVAGAGVAGVHVEVRVEPSGAAVRDLGSAPTHVLAPGSQTWMPLAPGQVIPVAPGTRIALGQRTFSYERP